MGRAIPLHPLWAVRPVHRLSACTRVHFTLLPLPTLKDSHKPITVTAQLEVHITLSCSTAFSDHLYKPIYAHDKIISYTYTEPSNKFHFYT